MTRRGRLSLSFLLFIAMVGWIGLAGAATIPKEAQNHNRSGNEYCEKGEFEKGAAEYEQAVKIFPNYADALYNLSMTYYLDLKNYEKAVRYMKQFLQVEGKSDDARQIREWLSDAEQKFAAMRESQTPPEGKESAAVAVMMGKGQAPEQVQAPAEAAGAAQSATKTAAPSGPQAVTEETVRPPVQPAVPKVAKAPSAERETELSVSAEPAVKAAAPPPRTGQFPPAAREIINPVVPPASPRIAKAPLPSREEGMAASLREEARMYKEKGNEYNRLGKPEEAVKWYERALEIYPEYTDALYNIGKTYDFDLKDYGKAKHYYRQFLQNEPPTSGDFAEVKDWLDRVEKAHQEQIEQAELEEKLEREMRTRAELAEKEKREREKMAQAELEQKRKAAQEEAKRVESITAGPPPGAQMAGIPAGPPGGARIAVAPKPAKAKTPSAGRPREVAEKRKPGAGRERLAGFITKGLLSGLSEGRKVAEPQQVASRQPLEPSVQEKKPDNPPSADQPASVRADLTPPPPPPPLPGAQKVAVAAVPPGTDTPHPDSPVARNRQIVIETLIPEDLIDTPSEAMSMERMRQEMVEILIQYKAKSPRQLADLFSRKVYSNILPSGEKVSYFQMEEKDLVNLPYATILTEEERIALEREKWDLYKSIKSKEARDRLHEVLTILRDGYKIVSD